MYEIEDVHEKKVALKSQKISNIAARKSNFK